MILLKSKNKTINIIVLRALKTKNKDNLKSIKNYFNSNFKYLKTDKFCLKS